MTNRALKERKASTPVSVNNRSKVTNGTRWFLSADADQRTPEARRFRDICFELAADLGGFELMTEAQKQLIRRAGMLAIQCELCESDWAAGRDAKLDDYVTQSNALRRLLQTLGLKRMAKDVTPTLSEIQAQYG